MNETTVSPQSRRTALPETSTTNCQDLPSSDQDVKGVSTTQRRRSSATGLAHFAQHPDLAAWGANTDTEDHHGFSPGLREQGRHRLTAIILLQESSSHLLSPHRHKPKPSPDEGFSPTMHTALVLKAITQAMSYSPCQQQFLSYGPKQLRKTRRWGLLPCWRASLHLSTRQREQTTAPLSKQGMDGEPNTALSNPC